MFNTREAIEQDFERVLQRIREQVFLAHGM